MNSRSTPWRTSSYSGNQANCVEVAASWRTSSYSGNQGNCVEVAGGESRIAVRDSKDKGGPVLAFDANDWTAFLTYVR